METVAGEPLISVRPFAVTKWSAWPVSKESRISETPSPVTLKSVTVSHPTILSSSPYNPAHKKTLGLGTPCVPNIMGRQKRAGMSSGECNGWPVSHHEPLDATGCVVQSSKNVPPSSSTTWPTTKHSMVLPIYHTDYNRHLEMPFPLCLQYANWSHQTGSWVTSKMLPGQKKNVLLLGEGRKQSAHIMDFHSIQSQF